MAARVAATTSVVLVMPGVFGFVGMGLSQQDDETAVEETPRREPRQSRRAADLAWCLNFRTNSAAGIRQFLLSKTAVFLFPLLDRRQTGSLTEGATRRVPHPC